MVFTLKIEKYTHGYYVETFEECIRIIEIEADSTLETLHLAIQEAVDFDNDHMYEFFIANSLRSREKLRFDNENEGVWNYTIKDLYPLKKHKKIFYLFDYGASWYFRISRTKDRPKEKVAGIEYPRVIGKVGGNPAQYDYEDWDDY